LHFRFSFETRFSEVDKSLFPSPPLRATSCNVHYSGSILYCNERETWSKSNNEVQTDSASESHSDNADDTSSEVGDEYESDPWAPLKVEAAQQSLSEFEELTQNFTAEGFDENEAKDKAYLLILPKLRKDLQNIYLERLLWIRQLKRDPLHK
jgi:hypothetical protein